MHLFQKISIPMYLYSSQFILHLVIYSCSISLAICYTKKMLSIRVMVFTALYCEAISLISTCSIIHYSIVIKTKSKKEFQKFYKKNIQDDIGVIFKYNVLYVISNQINQIIKVLCR